MRVFKSRGVQNRIWFITKNHFYLQDLIPKFSNSSFFQPISSKTFLGLILIGRNKEEILNMVSTFCVWSCTVYWAKMGKNLVMEIFLVQECIIGQYLLRISKVNICFQKYFN